MHNAPEIGPTPEVEPPTKPTAYQLAKPLLGTGAGVVAGVFVLITGMTMNSEGGAPPTQPITPQSQLTTTSGPASLSPGAKLTTGPGVRPSQPAPPGSTWVVVPGSTGTSTTWTWRVTRPGAPSLPEIPSTRPGAAPSSVPPSDRASPSLTTDPPSESPTPSQTSTPDPTPTTDPTTDPPPDPTPDPPTDVPADPDHIWVPILH